MANNYLDNIDINELWDEHNELAVKNDILTDALKVIRWELWEHEDHELFNKLDDMFHDLWGLDA